ncbi:MAG: flagellar filament capping protein FliD [bacterium]|jgi:flagellar capping protein FliD
MSSTSGIFFSGLNSGIQWDQIIDQLVSVQRRPVDNLIARREELFFRRSVSLEVNQRLASLTTALGKLKLESTFLSRTANSSDPAKVTATASAGAQRGSYQVEISRLARAGSATSGLNGAITAKSAYLGAGNTAGVTGLSVTGAFDEVRALPTTHFNALSQANSITAGDQIQVTGTDGDGYAVSETFTFAGDDTDTLQKFAQFLVGAFNGTAQVSIGYSGEIIVRQISGSGTLSFDPSSNLTFVDADFSGSTLSFGAGVSYTDGSSQGYGATGAFTLESTGLHEVSLTQGLPGRLISTSAMSAVDTLENLGVTAFSLSIDPDSGGSQIAKSVTGLTGKTTIQGLIDLINFQVPDVTAYLDGTGKLVIQANEGGRDIVAASAAGGVVDVFFGGVTTQDTSAPDNVNSFASNTTATDYTAVDRFAGDVAAASLRKASYGSEGSAISSLVAGVNINGGGVHTFGDGLAIIRTTESAELSSAPALAGRVVGARNVSSPSAATVPPMDVTETLSSANFATPVTAGTFTINGVQFTIGGLAATTVQDVIGQVNSSGAGVVMEYDGASDRFILRNANSGPQAITVGAGGDTSNFLAAARLTASTGAAFMAGRNKGAISLSEPLATAGFDTIPTTGSFTINGVNIFVDSSTDSLSTIINKINRSGAGVTASYSSATDALTLVQNLDENTTADYIVLGSTNDTSNFLSAMRLTNSPGVQTEVGTKRESAAFSINGISYTRPTNNPSDIVDGVSFNLLGTTSSPVTITIEADTTAAEDAIVEFIVEWNKTMEFINPKPLTEDERRRIEPLTREKMDQMSLADIDLYNNERQRLLKQQAIAGDGTVALMARRLRELLMGPVANSGKFRSLSEIGLTTGLVGTGPESAVDSRGRLLANTTDEETIRSLVQANSLLQDAIENNSDDLFTLFSNSLSSKAEVSGTKNLVAGVSLSNPLQFTIGDGVSTASVTIPAGYSTMNQVGGYIGSALAAAGLSGITSKFGFGYNLILESSKTDGSRAQIQINDFSEGPQGILDALGLASGTFLGGDPLVSGGVSTRTRNFIDLSTRVGGILFERTRTGGSFDRQIENLSGAIERGEAALVQYELRLRRQFAAMERALTEFQGQSQFLQQAIANLQSQQGNG